MGSTGAEAQGRYAELHAVPANDAASAKLVHKFGSPRHRRPAVPIRFRNFSWVSERWQSI